MTYHFFNSSLIPISFEISTEICPSGHISLIHFAIVSQISSSCADMVAISFTSGDVCLIVFVYFLIFSTILSPISCRFLLNTNGFVPFCSSDRPCFAIAQVRQVVVVVQSPTSLFVFSAASLIMDAQIFSTGSCKLISLAIVTPSFVTTGDLSNLPRTAFLPQGPIEDITAVETIFIPSNNFLRASSHSNTVFDIFSTTYSIKC